MAETINTNQFKNGMCIELDGVVWKIIEFQHVKPGKGGAFVRTRLKQMEGGKVVEKTFRAGESMPRVHTTVQELQYLKEGDVVQLLSLDGRPASLQLPAAVELVVSSTEPGVKGDTVSNVTKPAVLETGATVQVPLFVNEGERVRVDTRDGRYLGRA